MNEAPMGHTRIIIDAPGLVRMVCACMWNTEQPDRAFCEAAYEAHLVGAKPVPEEQRVRFLEARSEWAASQGIS